MSCIDIVFTDTSSNILLELTQRRLRPECARLISIPAVIVVPRDITYKDLYAKVIYTFQRRLEKDHELLVPFFASQNPSEREACEMNLLDILYEHPLAVERRILDVYSSGKVKAKLGEITDLERLFDTFFFREQKSARLSVHWDHDLLMKIYDEDLEVREEHSSYKRARGQQVERKDTQVEHVHREDDDVMVQVY